jgi:SAM-dependent methyltransferase
MRNWKNRLARAARILAGSPEGGVAASPAGEPVTGQSDPRMCGLRDAVLKGWYNSETGELFTGFKISDDDVVLDVGCGDGGALLFCARQGAHVVFTDIVESKVNALVDKAKKSKARKVEGFVSDSLPLPLSDQYVTKVLSMEMLEHTKDPERILKELVRVGKPGAQYMITVPDSRSETLQKPIAAPVYFKEPNHIQIFDKNRLVSLIEKAGLQIERYETWGFYWTMLMSLFWIVGQEGQETNYANPIHDEIIGKKQYHPVIQNWSNTWDGVMNLGSGKKMIDVLDDYLPKAQMVIARKK